MEASRGQRNSAGRGKQTLPLWGVEKIMKKVLPAKAWINKEAKERVQECSSKFAAVIIKRAAEECKKDGRFEIDGLDIIKAMSYLGLHDYVNQLKNYPRQYRNIDESELELEPEPELELEPEPEPEQEMSTRPTPESHLCRFHHGGDYPKGILAVGTAESFQHVPALILSKIY